jgi:thiol-disulfide isomerase/thioredoxin
MKKLIVLLILLAAVLFTAGCAERTLGNSTSSNINLEKSTIKVTQLEQINTSLQKGPVFVKIGSKWCSACRSMQPILGKLATEYVGKATIASIDADQNSELTEYFGVQGIPDSFVIVGIENGTYVYMQEDGNVSMNKSQSSFVGLSEDSEKVFKQVLDLAVLQQGKNESK